MTPGAGHDIALYRTIDKVVYSLAVWSLRVKLHCDRAGLRFERYFRDGQISKGGAYHSAQFRVLPCQIQPDLLAPLRVGSVITEPRAAGWTLRSRKLRSASGHEEQCSQKEEIESHELCILSQGADFRDRHRILKYKNSVSVPKIPARYNIRHAKHDNDGHGFGYGSIGPLLPGYARTEAAIPVARLDRIRCRLQHSGSSRRRHAGPSPRERAICGARQYRLRC